MKRRSTKRATKLTAASAADAPLLIGLRNSEAVVGQPHRWVLAQARMLGVEILTVGGRHFVRASEFVPALEREQHDALPAELVAQHKADVQDLAAAGDTYGTRKENEAWRIQLALRRELNDEERGALLVYELGLAAGVDDGARRRLRTALNRLILANGGPLLTQSQAKAGER